jgi:hypothetical protein
VPSLDRISALQRFLAEKAERLGRRLKLRVLLRSFDAVCRFVECDVGVGVVPATTALRLSSHGDPPRRPDRRLGRCAS